MVQQVSDAQLEYSAQQKLGDREGLFGRPRGAWGRPPLLDPPRKNYADGTDFQLHGRRGMVL